MHDNDPNRQARREAGILSRLSPQGIADLEKMLGEVLGMSLSGKVQPEQATPSPSRQAEGEAPADIPNVESPPSIDAFNERASKGMDYDDLVARLLALGASV
jgi:hypothetical protein